MLSLQSKIQQTNPKYPALQLNSLTDSQMPKFKMSIDEVTYYYSEPFQFDSSNIAVMALVQVDDKVYPRIFYRSNSQACWRVMPAVAKGDYKRLGKGLGESDTQVPIALNLALQDLSTNSGRNPSAQDLVKTGVDFTATYKDKTSIEPLVHVAESAEKWFEKGGNIIMRCPAPAAIKLPEKQSLHPNFKTCVTTKTFTDPHYGKLVAKVYLSHDESLQYQFYEAEDGRVFLSGVERIKDNPINIFGVREKALDLNGMDAPLLEYWNQVPRGHEPSANPPFYQSSKYTSNWNYLRELEVIQLYYSEQGRELPPKI